MNNYDFKYIPKNNIFKNNDNYIEELNLLSIPINQHNWNIGIDLPIVSLKGGWNEKGLYLFFDIQENESKMEFTKLNDPVYRDSCVEFFIKAIKNKKTYCNFEFNALGTFLSQTGDDRNNRKFIDKTEAKSIQINVNRNLKSSIKRNRWNLSVMIPSNILLIREIILEPEKSYRCNFYKCGDDLKDPHYLSWNPISIKNPDFHRTDFFGNITLKKSAKGKEKIDD